MEVYGSGQGVQHIPIPHPPTTRTTGHSTNPEPNRMIVDAATGPWPCSGRTYDVCIVGAGAAGITLALELGRAGLQVCVLEAGGLGYESGVQGLLDGEVAHAEYPALRDTRLAGLGGSTAVWAGWCRPLDETDFLPDPVRAMPGWPFTLRELEPDYRRAQVLCGLGPYAYGIDEWSRKLGGKPWLSDGPFVEKIVQVRAQHFGTAFLEDLERSDGIVVVLHATVRRARMDKGRVVALEALIPGRSPQDVFAETYVFAAGGVENARLLLASGDTEASAPGNQGGLVGRFFADHVFVEMGAVVMGEPGRPARYLPQAIFSDRAQPTVRAVWSLSEGMVAREHIPNGALFVHPRYASHAVYRTREVRAFLELWNKFNNKAVPGDWFRYLAAAASAPHRVLHAALRKLLIKGGDSARWHVRAMFETEFHPNSRVSLGDTRDHAGRRQARLDWEPSERDIEGMRRFTQLFEDALKRRGDLRFERAFPDEASAWRRAAESGKHHMGTTRMHPDPGLGVVDEDSRVHGTKNLHVTGSSVFPSGGWVNPTLTIVALAVRLARFLGGRTAG